MARLLFDATMESYQKLSAKALPILVPFATTYLGESGFSSLLHSQNKYRNCLNHSHNSHVALSNCVPGYERIVSEKQQQKSLGLLVMSSKE